MKLTPSESKFSDEELEAFLQEIELFEQEKESPQEEELPLPLENKSLIAPSVFVPTPKKNSFFLWLFLIIPLTFGAGFSVGWFTKLTSPAPRSIEVVGEEILQLFQELRKMMPTETPTPADVPTFLPGGEIIEPIEGLDDFSVA